VYEVILRLGWVGIPLGICSILALAIVVERTINLRERKLFNRNLLIAVEASVEAADGEGALRAARTTPGVLSELLRAGLETYKLSPEEVRGAIHEMTRHEAPALQRNLGLLGTVASISPMLGLLGTVSGMVQTFGKISVDGAGKATALAGGIHEALTTTVVGLVIAIPSVVAYNHFGEKAKTALIDMERHALRAARILRARETGVATSSLGISRRAIK